MKTVKRITQDTKRVFKIQQHGKQNVEISVESPFGFFIKEAGSASNYRDLNKIIGLKGLRYKSVRPLMKFLDLTSYKIADLTGVSQRTVARWNEDSTIGVLPSKNLVKVDTIVQKGIEVFGSDELFKAWLQQPNSALGDDTPMDLLSTPYGVELVEDALEAMEYGNVM